MPPTLQELGLDRLSAADRLAVADALYDSVADDAPLTPAQTAELERRLAASVANPGVGTPWEVIEARSLARARQ